MPETNEPTPLPNDVPPIGQHGPVSAEALDLDDAGNLHVGPRPQGGGTAGGFESLAVHLAR